jgi:hypothetical protein
MEPGGAGVVAVYSEAGGNIETLGIEVDLGRVREDSSYLVDGNEEHRRRSRKAND